MSFKSAQIDTNQIFIEQKKDPKTNKIQKNIFIPGYFRLKVKNFTQMNLDSLCAQMNATLIFTVYYGNLDKNSVEKLKDGIILLFGRDDAIKLTEEKNLEIKVKQQIKKQQIQFLIRKLFYLRIDSEVFWSPFQIINLILTVTVQPVQTDEGTIKINLMDFHQNNFTKISYTKEGTFGNYDLAEKLMRAEYSNERTYKGLNKNSDCWAKFKNCICKLCQKKQIPIQSPFDKLKQDKKFKFQNFQYAHFNVPLYKFPVVALATIFIPLWLLAVINLGIFFQENSLADRIGSIAALMIAFVALIPTIREQIPPNPEIVFVEILVYFQTLTSLFALIHSMSVRNEGKFNLIWYQSGLFLLSAIITILTIIIVLFMMTLHQFYWKRNYNQDFNTNDQQIKFDRKKWVNNQCNQYFRNNSKLHKRKLMPLKKKISFD